MEETKSKEDIELEKLEAKISKMVEEFCIENECLVIGRIDTEIKAVLSSSKRLPPEIKVKCKLVSGDYWNINPKK